MLDIPTCCPYLDTGHFDSANAQTISIQFKALSKLCDPLCLCGWMLLIECVDLARRPKFRKVESGIDRVSSALRHIKCGHGNTGHKDRILPPTPTYSDFDALRYIYTQYIQKSMGMGTMDTPPSVCPSLYGVLFGNGCIVPEDAQYFDGWPQRINL